MHAFNENITIHRTQRTHVVHIDFERYHSRVGIMTHSTSNVRRHAATSKPTDMESRRDLMHFNTPRRIHMRVWDPIHLWDPKCRQIHLNSTTMPLRGSTIQLFL